MTPRASQPPVTVRTFTQRFSATRRGARLARLLAAQQAVDWGVPRGTTAHEALVTVVGELAANAVLHGRVPGRDFELHLRRGDGCVHVEVSDTHQRRPTLLPAGLDAEGGRGLVLVGALALRWGVRERNGPGKTVWAECATRFSSARPAPPERRRPEGGPDGGPGPG
ncbi:ATP-binding protein [Streptomyces sp. NRRL S-87]|uniref:ATP-binding protein n=1 Tax=Streptomyces sp. NRRL S-87 TaxID=1463920 RepID=UPI00068EFCFD|nr:ATP-binding protein [Streptomyces sp. NRRL S-87]